MQEKGHHHEEGKSSFAMIDRDRLFTILDLQTGTTFLDIGCGKGEYSVAASHFVGDSGRVISLDKWEQGIQGLIEDLQTQGRTNIYPSVADVSVNIPVADQVIDTCLMSMVLHGFAKNEIAGSVLKEVGRVAKPNARLAVIEWKKIEGPPGPAMDIRLSEHDLEQLVEPIGFSRETVSEIGSYLYLMTFRKTR